MNTLLLEPKNDYLIVRLNRGRANAINQEMVGEFLQVIRAAEADDKVAGIIIAGRGNFFSAGLDVLEMYDYDEAEMAAFWNGFLDLVQALTAFSKPLVSAITGHSPAGGCILAICSDYRVMTDQPKFRIGLNEVPVGIVVPNGVLALYAFWLGENKAYQALMNGYLFPAPEALAAGLVDELAPAENVIAAAEEQMGKYLRLPRAVWQKTKGNLRRGLLEASRIPAEERQITLDQWWSAESRRVMGGVVAGLRAKKGGR